MAITKFQFAEHDGKEIEGYKLSNEAGYEVTVISFGAIITSIMMPDKNGELADITLGWPDFAGYTTNPSYFGAVCGRVANRVGGAKFSLDGKDFTLASNNGKHSLHGGNVGFDKKIWTAEIDGSKLTLTYVSPGGEEGYPGNLTSKVTYELTEGNELAIDYHATTDAPTIVNLTNHTYFNLAGKGDVKGHVIESPIKHYTAVDADSIPTGELASVEGTAFDFSTPTAIGARCDSLEIGYDHNLCVNRDGVADGQLALALKVKDPESERAIEVQTTEPGIQLYTGWYLDDFKGRGGAVYTKYSGFCLETQHFPDAIHQPKFAPIVVRPDAPYTSKTVYKFSSPSKKRKAPEQLAKA